MLSCIQKELHNNQLVTTAVAVFGKGPSYGLTLTLNVEQYENVPFLYRDTAVKVSLSSAINFIECRRQL